MKTAVAYFPEYDRYLIGLPLDYFQDPVALITIMYVLSSIELLRIYENAPAESVLKRVATIAIQLHMDSASFDNAVHQGLFNQGVASLLEAAEKHKQVGGELCPILSELSLCGDKLGLTQKVQEDIAKAIDTLCQYWGFVIKTIDVPVTIPGEIADFLLPF